MKKILANKYFLLISRIVLGFIFIYAATEKIADPAGFADSINNYKIFPILLINISAVVIPWIELTAGLLLVFGVAVKENVLILDFLLVIFILLISISLLRGLNIDCGCFGTKGGQSIGIQKIAEDFIFLLLGIQVYFFDSGELSITSIKLIDKD